jgi:O-antigen/teichoic acid export membrane protein
LILAALFAASSGVVAGFFHEPRLQTVILVMSLNFVLVAFSNIGLSRLQREMRFTALAWMGIASTTAHATGSIVLAWMGYGAVGMAWASVMNIVVCLICSYLCYPGDLFLIPGFHNWRRLFSFGLFSSGGRLLQTVSLRIPDVIVGRLLGLEMAGMYSRGNGLITLFEQALIQAVSPVALGALAVIKRDDGDLRAPYLRYLAYTTAIAWPALALMYLLALPIITIAFGSQWLAAIPVARVLCISAAFMVVGGTAMTLLTAVGAVRRIFVLQGLGVPLQVVSLVIGACFSIEATAWGFAVSNFLLALLSVREVRRVMPLTWKESLSTLWPSLAATAATMVGPIAVMLWRTPSVTDLWYPTMACGMAGLAGWLIFMLGTGHPFAAEIRMVLGKLAGRLRSGDRARRA